MYALRNGESYAIIYDSKYKDDIYSLIDNFEGNVSNISSTDIDTLVEHAIFNNENVLIVDSNSITNYKNGMLYREDGGIAIKKITDTYVSSCMYRGHEFYLNETISTFSIYSRLKIDNFELCIYNTFNTYNVTIKYEDVPSLVLYIYDNISIDVIKTSIKNIDYNDCLVLLYYNMCEEYSNDIEEMLKLFDTNKDGVQNYNA